MKQSSERAMAVEQLGEVLGALRLHDVESQRQMQWSLRRYGQLSPLLAFGDQAGLQVVDGFKRLRAARELGWKELLVEELRVEDRAQAKAAMVLCNLGHRLQVMEEALVVRSLYREDGLTQPEVGRLLGRHKSWVCRRLMLAECVANEVEADVRLGLLSARAAVELARLPRGNQVAAAKVVMSRGLTVQQAHELVHAALGISDESGRAAFLSRALEGAVAKRDGAAHRAKTDAEWMLMDIATLTKASARLQVRLHHGRLLRFGEQPAALLMDALTNLRPVLLALCATIERVDGGSHADVAQPGRNGFAGRDVDASGNATARHRAGGAGEPQHGAQDPRGAREPEGTAASKPDGEGSPRTEGEQAR